MDSFRRVESVENREEEKTEGRARTTPNRLREFFITWTELMSRRFPRGNLMPDSRRATKLLPRTKLLLLPLLEPSVLTAPLPPDENLKTPRRSPSLGTGVPCEDPRINQSLAQLAAASVHAGRSGVSPGDSGSRAVRKTPRSRGGRRYHSDRRHTGTQGAWYKAWSCLLRYCLLGVATYC